MKINTEDGFSMQELTGAASSRLWKCGEMSQSTVGETMENLMAAVRAYSTVQAGRMPMSELSSAAEVARLSLAMQREYVIAHINAAFVDAMAEIDDAEQIVRQTRFGPSRT